MRQRRIIETVLSVMCLLTPCLAHHMAVVTDKANTIQDVRSAQLAKIFKGEVKKWPDGLNLVVVMHGSSGDEIRTLARLTKMTDDEVKAMVAAHTDSIRRVATDADVIEMVASTPGAIGMVEEHSITDRVKVIKVDGKLPMETGYLPH